MSLSAIPTDRCGAAIARLESDIRDKCAEDRWRESIREGLIALREAMAPSSYPVNLAEELFHDAPRLSRAIQRIGSEREQLTGRVEALLSIGPDTSTAMLGASVRQLVSEVRRHRRRVSDLLHEAYVVDIGGEM